MQKSINGATFRKMVMVANKVLDANQKYIDSLNVFPVPDGDTGKNMGMTFKSASTAVNECGTAEAVRAIPTPRSFKALSVFSANDRPKEESV